METLDARRQVLEGELANAKLPAPRLHPNLAEVYRQRMARLAEVLAEDDNAEAREVVRGLVETIRLLPQDGSLRIELRGELGGILRFADPERPGRRRWMPRVILSPLMLLIPTAPGMARVNSGSSGPSSGRGCKRHCKTDPCAD